MLYKVVIKMLISGMSITICCGQLEIIVRVVDGEEPYMERIANGFQLAIRCLPHDPMYNHIIRTDVCRMGSYYVLNKYF